MTETDATTKADDEKNLPSDIQNRVHSEREEVLLLERELGACQTVDGTITKLWQWINKVMRVLERDFTDAADKFAYQIEVIKHDFPIPVKQRAIPTIRSKTEVYVGDYSMGKAFSGPELKDLIEISEAHAEKLYAIELQSLQSQMTRFLPDLIGWDDDPTDERMTPEKQRIKDRKARGIDDH